MPRSLHGTSSVWTALGRKTITRYRPTGAHPLLVAPISSRRIGFYIVNRDDADVYIGDAAVTVATGIPLPAGAEFEDLESYDEWYAITAGVLGDVIVVETEVDP